MGEAATQQAMLLVVDGTTLTVDVVARAGQWFVHVNPFGGDPYNDYFAVTHEPSGAAACESLLSLVEAGMLLGVLAPFEFEKKEDLPKEAIDAVEKLWGAYCG